jgi:hypothetical protein
LHSGEIIEESFTEKNTLPHVLTENRKEKKAKEKKDKKVRKDKKIKKMK